MLCIGGVIPNEMVHYFVSISLYQNDISDCSLISNDQYLNTASKQTKFTGSISLIVVIRKIRQENLSKKANFIKWQQTMKCKEKLFTQIYLSPIELV